MTDQNTTQSGVLTPARSKTLAATLAGIVLALAGALANSGGGETGIEITTAPHPGTVAQLAALDHRLAAVERRIEEAGAQAALIESLRARLDLLLSGARVHLDNEPPPRSRR